MTYKSYTVNDSTVFAIAGYPEIADELRVFRERLGTSPLPLCADMVISYNKDHKLNKLWVQEQGSFVEQLLAYFGKNTHTESLFAAGKSNKTFIAALEAHIVSQFP